MIDITNGIETANLSECKIQDFHNHFVCKKNNQPIQNGVFGCRISDVKNRTFQSEGFSGCRNLSNGNVFIFDDNDVNTLKYSSSNPFVHYAVFNPTHEGGANGVVITESQHNIMITSGQLSGCVFAVLVKGRQLMVIHAGAETTTIKDPDGLHRNADMFAMANYLTHNKLFCQISEMDIKSTIESLEALRFKGFVFFNSPKSNVSIKTANLIGYSYSTNDYIYPKADVVCVINKKGEMQIALRPLSNNHDVSSKYKLWTTQL